MAGKDRPGGHGKNRFAEALKESHNVVGLASSAALSMMLLNPLPLLVGLVAEAAYLIFVPDSRWYASRLAKRYDAEIERRRQALKDRIIPTLRPDLQERYARLEQTRIEIGAQSSQDETWFREVLRKLDYLLEKFIHFSSKDGQFRAYLASVLEEVRNDEANVRRKPGSVEYRVLDRRGNETRPRAAAQPAGLTRDPSDQWVAKAVAEIQRHYDDEMTDIRGVRDAEQDPNTRAVLDKRLDVLQRRREYVEKIGKILTNLSHQLKLLEDSFGLINDEIRARSPEQVLSDIDDVVWQTDTMTSLLEEVAPYEQMLERMSA